MSPVYDMSQYGVDEASEPVCIEAGKECELRIESVRVDTDKNGYDYWMPLYSVVSVADGERPDNVKRFSDFLGLPDQDLSAQDNSDRAWKLNCFLRAIGLDPSGSIDPENDLVGKECWAILGLKSDANYGDQNTVRKYVAGK